MADIRDGAAPAPPSHVELYQAAVEQAVNTHLLWGDIECHLNEVKAQIAALREAIRTFELKK